MAEFPAGSGSDRGPWNTAGSRIAGVVSGPA